MSVDPLIQSDYQPTETPGELQQSLSASPCRMISAWTTWQQATGNLSEHHRPDGVIQTLTHTHTHSHWATAICFGQIRRERGDGDIFQLLSACDSDRGLRYCLVVGEWTHSPPTENTHRQEGNGGMDVGQDDVTCRARRGFSGRLKKHQQGWKRCVATLSLNRRNSAYKALAQTGRWWLCLRNMLGWEWL